LIHFSLDKVAADGKAGCSTILLFLIEALVEGSAHFREQAEAWLADVLGEEAAALMVDRPCG